MRTHVLRALTFLIVIAIVLPLAGPFSVPVATTAAQTDAPPVLILPVNQAQFLPGVFFDIRVEVHADVLPEDFSATIDGQPIGEFFGAEGISETWEFGSTPTTSNSVIWRNVFFQTAGVYTVEVIAGGETHTVVWTVREISAGAGARNVILFIADGGSVGVFTAARLISRGMEQGTYNSYLSFEEFEEFGLLSTSGIDSIITDSANSASAYNTGHKTAVNANGVYPDTSPDLLDDPRTEKLASILKRTRGMSIGIVTTSDWTDATPVAVFGYGRDRSTFTRLAFAAQPLDEGLFPEVIFGGGARYLLPTSVEGGRRTDERNLFDEYEAAGYTVVTTNTELQAAVAENPERIIGMFHPSDMNVWLDRNVFTDNLGTLTDQPGLVDMTLAALEVLNQNPNGFFLEVEAASIDKQLHPMDFDRALADTIEFDRAVAAAVEWAAANAPDTLIIVTADHAHSYDVYGTVDVVAFNDATDDSGRRNAIGIYNAAGFTTYEDADGDFFPDDWAPSVVLAQGKVENPPFTEDFQVSPVPRVPSSVDSNGFNIDNPDDDPNGLPLGGNLPEGATSSVHTLQDVPVYATGPGADYFGRVQENIEVFFGIAYALGLDPIAEAQ